MSCWWCGEKARGSKEVWPAGHAAAAAALANQVGHYTSQCQASPVPVSDAAWALHALGETPTTALNTQMQHAQQPHARVITPKYEDAHRIIAIYH
jgi:hypothetical protein